MNPAVKIIKVVDNSQRRHPWLGFPVAVWKKFGDDEAGNLAALVAYYAFASIFPLLLVLVTVLDLVLRNHPALRTTVVDSAFADFPVIGPQLKNNIGSLNETGLALAIGLAGTFLGARGVANAAQNALNVVWEVPKADRPGFPWGWLRSFGWIVVVGLGVIITTGLSGVAGGAPLPAFGGRVAATAVALALNFGVFWLSFRLGTARHVTWRHLWPGALTGACAWQVLQVAGGYIIAHDLTHAKSLYGVFGIVLGLLAWLYLIAEVTLYAVEANVVYVRRLWPRSLAPPPYTVQDRRAFELYAESERRLTPDAERQLNEVPREVSGQGMADGDRVRNRRPGGHRRPLTPGPSTRRPDDDEA